MKRYKAYKNLKNFHFILFIFIFSIISNACVDEFSQQEKYQAPEWLKGKIFSQVQNEDDLSIFISFLENTGYDTILNTSGSFTVFAPTDEAFEQFFEENPNYKTLLESDEPSTELNALIEYQILYNAWTQEQFHGVYKKMTLFREENKSYPVKLIGGNTYQIAESSEDDTFKSYTQANKFCPIFIDDYLRNNDLDGSDFEVYFNRPYTPDKLYFAGAEFEDEIPAENGFIYKTDRVILPLPNGEDILKKGSENHSYTKFLNLIQQFSIFRFNLQATNEQPGVEEGLEVDNLYDLEYPSLVFNISTELTGGSLSSTYNQHNGLMVPTDLAFESFMNEYFPGLDNYNSLRPGLKKLIVNSHMSDEAIYTADLGEGILNGIGDIVFLNEDDIIQHTYGSNCTFLGLQNAIVPRVFSSICRPLYLENDFETMMYASEKTDIISALNMTDVNYTFYLPGDQYIGEFGDSSLLREVTNAASDQYRFVAYNRADEKMENISTNDLRNVLLNQISSSIPDGIANKEFLRTLGGRYIIVNNVSGTASGTARSRFGYQGDSTITLTPNYIEQETDNGVAYQVNGWFKFSGTSYQGLLSSKYPKFIALLTKAGLYDPVFYNFPFLVDGEYYTVFIPSEQALNDFGVDDLSEEELRDLLKFHFVRGDLVFTDGKKPEGYYSTKLEKDNSSSYTEFYELKIRPEPDAIQILAKNGDDFCTVVEIEGETNQIIWYDSNENSNSEWDFIATGIVHNIDKVLVRDSLQVN